MIDPYFEWLAIYPEGLICTCGEKAYIPHFGICDRCEEWICGKCCTCVPRKHNTGKQIHRHKK